MGWTKVDRAKFLKAMDESNGLMPREAITKQKTIFEDILETTEVDPKYQKVRLALMYPKINEGDKGNPIPKQSARFTARRHNADDAYGNKKGDVLVYVSKRTGKKDVIITSYQDARITTTTKMLRLQAEINMKNNKWFMFKGCVFITRMEFIFQVSKNAPQYMLNDLKNNQMIYFKDTAPDLDNLEKIVWDSMQAEKMENDVMKSYTGLLYENDAQIVSKNGIFKRWGLRPGVIIEMEGYIQ